MNQPAPMIERLAREMARDHFVKHYMGEPGYVEDLIAQHWESWIVDAEKEFAKRMAPYG